MAAIPDGVPAPFCTHPGCKRRCHLMYRRNSDGLRVFRATCRFHRPHYSGPMPLNTYPRPPADSAWPPEQRCPFCNRRREPSSYSTHVRRATCRAHRFLAPIINAKKKNRRRIDRLLRQLAAKRYVASLSPRDARPSPAPPEDPRPLPPLPPPAPSSKVARARKFLPAGDLQVLRACYDSGKGHYASATDERLSRPVPTAKVIVLFSRWAEEEEEKKKAKGKKGKGNSR